MAGLGERLLQAEPLAPVLQDVGEVPLGQARAARPAAPARSSGLPGCRRRPGRWPVRRRSTRSGGRAARAIGGRSALRGSRPPAPGRRRPAGRRRRTAGCAPGPSNCRIRLPLHGVDPLLRLGRPAARSPAGRRTAAWALRAACSGVMIMARSPGCGLIGCVETDVLPQGASLSTAYRHNSLPANEVQGSGRRVTPNRFCSSGATSATVASDGGVV